MSSSLTRRLLTRGVVAVTATASIVAGLPVVASSAAPVGGAVRAAQVAAEATIEQRIAAADVYGLGSDDALLARTGDCNFVIGVWEYLRDNRPASQEVRTAAEWAFTESGQPCYDFIVTEIFTAKRRDDANAIAAADEKRQREDARTAAAASIDVVADAALLAGTDEDFVRRIWERVAEDAKWPKVKAAARTAREGTPEEQRAFIAGGMADAAKQDKDDAIAADEQKSAEEKARLLARAAKQSAANRVGLTVTENLLNLPDRDFVIEVWNGTEDGTDVQAAAIRAARSLDPAVWKAFIDTGIHVAKDSDIAKALKRKADEDLALTRTVLANAVAKNWRNLAAAARSAVKGTPDEVADFLRVRQYQVKADAKGDTVGYRSAAKLCLEIENASMDEGGHALHWTCGTGTEFRWVLAPVSGAVEIRNEKSALCLSVVGAAKTVGAHVAQRACTGDADQSFTVDTNAAGQILVRNRNADKCLVLDGEVAGTPARAGTHVVLGDCAGATARLWQAVPKLETGLENGQTQLTWTNTVENAKNVSKVCCSLPGPELARTASGRSSSSSLLYSGQDDNATQSFAYVKAFDLKGVKVTPTTKLSYWIYPESHSAKFNHADGINSSCVAVDLVFSTGSPLRDTGVKDQRGNRAHPAYQCSKLKLDTWTEVVVPVGTVANGRLIQRVTVGYDQPAATGGYRGFIDDIRITH